MAFGSGVLVASLAFSLIEEAFEMSQSIPSVIIGFISGGLANYYLDKRTSKGNIRHRKKSHRTDVGGGNASGLAMLVGSVMDNIPENWFYFVIIYRTFSTGNRLIIRCRCNSSDACRIDDSCSLRGRRSE